MTVVTSRNQSLAAVNSSGTLVVRRSLVRYGLDRGGTVTKGILWGAVVRTHQQKALLENQKAGKSFAISRTDVREERIVGKHETFRCRDESGVHFHFK